LSEVFEICDRATILRGGKLIGTFEVADVDRSLLVEHMLGRSLGQMYPQSAHTQKGLALEVENLHIPGTLESLSFTVGRGEIVCLAGQIGSGATTAVRALAGLVHDA